ncbi:hypothetical protein ACIBG8_37170 [Nonomuraea sp. NPDC050556]|uniref:hypothetical protein n=1 Tax=Nonomuraea sp. NPDC050556 TaxID=3364369 RepID=UPI003787BC64
MSTDVSAPLFPPASPVVLPAPNGSALLFPGEPIRQGDFPGEAVRQGDARRRPPYQRAAPPPPRTSTAMDADATPTADLPALSATAVRTMHRLQRIRAITQQGVALSDHTLTAIDQLLRRLP